ncbi:pectate lyase [Jiangella aurantiaca]|uniref:Pectate lyase n=1 Tax=Jiangella aurantiaca TaxID=2530373 RepID=A0A4V2YRH3_9ACTN|nr:pectate lyase [Jiangella aurantiaca]
MATAAATGAQAEPAATGPAAGAQTEPLLAFPGAEGFGRYATGGRGGTVYHVTNLDDSGPGSFRDAVSEPNRTIVFEVGGVITIGERIRVAPNITIAGQTAPGEGITIYGNGLSFTDANGTIARHFRVRQGIGGDSGTDAITVVTGDTMIFDHLSVTWGRDEVFSVSNGDPADGAHNVTIQNSILGQGLDTHSAGGLIETAGGVSLLRNLYLDNDIRNPKVKGVNQYVNNVVYNWRREAYILGGSQWTSEANVQNNYFIAGPSTETGPFTRGNENFHLFAEDNYHDADRDGALDGYEVPREEYTTVTWMEKPYPYPPVADLMDPDDAYEYVVEHAGASLNRDRVDGLLVGEVTSLGRKGAIISDENAPPINGPGPVRGGDAPRDTDRDGMPDWWERLRDLDPEVPGNNADGDGDGYTDLEEYLNWRASH